MATPPDKATVQSTLSHIGRELMVQKFALRGVIKRRNQLRKDEIATRERIRSLENRHNWEIDNHPDMFPQMDGPGTEGDNI